MNIFVQKNTRLVPLFLGVITFTVSAQTEISPACFEAMHVATYASQENAKTAIDQFKKEGCAQNLEATFKFTSGVPPKGIVSAPALLALVYHSNKRRSEIAEQQAIPTGSPTTATASAAIGGRLSLDFPMTLPPDLARQLSGGSASFRPSNRLQNQLIEELRGSGAAAIRRP